MKWIWQRSILALLVLFVLAWPLLAPAHWLAVAVGRLSGDQIRLAEAQGRWYAGGARLCVRLPGEGGWRALGDLQWRLFDAAALLSVRLDQGQIRVNMPGGRPSLSFSAVTLPAQYLTAFGGTDGIRAQYRGQIDFEQGRLQRQASQHWHGDGVVHWRQASSSLLANYPLGDIRLQWHLDEQLQMTFFNEKGGPVELNGSLATDVKSGARSLSATLRFTDAPPETLISTLQRLGMIVRPEIGDFVYQMNLQI